MRHAYRLAAALMLAVMLPAALAHAGDSTVKGPIVVAPTPGEVILSPPVLTISFPDQSNLHNMGIASDGFFYYTCDGGNAAAGRISTFDLSGNLVRRVACNLDMRALLWNRADGLLYAKTFEGDLWRVDPVTGGASLVHAGMFAFAQSSPAITSNGLTILEHESGLIRFLDFASGALLNTMTGFAYGGYPSNEAVGVSDNRIYTWDGNMTSVYDFAGNLIESYVMPQGDYGFSLKFVNGLLFTSTDGYSGVGTWYGWNVGAVVDARTHSWGALKALYR